MERKDWLRIMQISQVMQLQSAAMANKAKAGSVRQRKDQATRLVASPTSLGCHYPRGWISDRT